MTDEKPQETKRKNLQQRLWFFFTLGFAALMLFLAFRGVNWEELLGTLGKANGTWLFLGFLVLSFSYFLRSLRWRLLLNAEASISVASVFWATNIGYLGNAFLPARAGEFLRTLVIRRSSSLGLVYIFTTAITERIVDAAFLALLAVITLSQLSESPAWLSNAAQWMALLGATALTLMFLLPRLQGFFEMLIRKMPIKSSWHELLEKLLQNLSDAMRLLYRPKIALLFLLLTLLIWSVDVVFTLCIAAAFGIKLEISTIVLLLAALGLASAAPSTPGYIGIYQFVSVSVLSPFGISQDQALALIIAFQGVTYLLLIFWGLLAIWRTNLFKEGISTKLTQEQASERLKE